MSLELFFGLYLAIGLVIAVFFAIASKSKSDSFFVLLLVPPFWFFMVLFFGYGLVREIFDKAEKNEALKIRIEQNKRIREQILGVSDQTEIDNLVSVLKSVDKINEIIRAPAFSSETKIIALKRKAAIYTKYLEIPELTLTELDLIKQVAERANMPIYIDSLTENEKNVALELERKGLIVISRASGIQIPAVVHKLCPNDFTFAVADKYQ